MLPVLRPHQENDLAALRAECGAGRNPVLVAPCGYGKGTLISVIVHNATQRGHNVIFAVHGKSLVVDMSQRIAKLGIEHGVLLGGERRERWHKVQVASIDTLHRMAHPPAASLVIVDEAHMAMSPTWRKTLDRYPQARVIGATATPIRLDGKGLGKSTGGLFDSMVLGPCERELIGMGYLVRSRVLQGAPIDTSKIRKTAGEFNMKDLAGACDKVTLIGDIVEQWKKHAAGRKTAAFGVDQAHARHIRNQFNDAGISWSYVDADTKQEDRAKIWEDLDRGSLMGVSSVGCISVGWDHPVVSCLIMARPTASFGLWRQMLGRGSRPNRGKDDFLVLDHADNTRRFEYGMFEDEVPWSLDGAAIKEGAKKPPPVATCKYSYKWPDFRNGTTRLGDAIINGLQMPCYGTFRPGPKQCPFCDIPLRFEGRKIEVEKRELTEVPSAERMPVSLSHRPAYEGMMQKALNMGYKPGWAGFAFKGKFGYWPPKQWAVEFNNKSMKEMANA